MPLDSSDFLNLKLSIDDLARAERDLTAAILKTGSPAGAVGPQAQAAAAAQGAAARSPGQPGVGSPAWQAQKPDNAPGFGLSAVRQALNAGGATTAGGLVGGLGAGPAALGAVGIGAIREAVNESIERPRNAAKAAFSAYSKTDTSDTESIAKYRARQAIELSQIESDEETDHTVKGRLTYDGKELAQRDFTRAQNRRQIAQDMDDELAPQERALAGTRRQLEDYARAGGMKPGPEGDKGRKLADQIYKFNVEREKNAQDFEKWARVRDQRMTSTSPGAQGAHLGL